MKDELAGRSPLNLISILGLMFASGFAALVYQILWTKRLGILLGNTPAAAGTTLAVFFGGLALGSAVFGRRCASIRRPLRFYALLELAVALSALLYFMLPAAYSASYAALYRALGHHPALALALKLTLTLAILLPPAFFMGGTLPVLCHAAVRRIATLGRRASAMYAANTVGAALGAYVAGFHLVRWFGVERSYWLAVGITLAVATVAWLMSRGEPAHTSTPSSHAERDSKPALLYPGSLRFLAFLSGYGTLSLEVLWTRMFSQVLQNSVYTFSAILVVFLAALGLGAILANWLIRRSRDLQNVVFGLMVTAGLLVGASPFLLYHLTDGLSYLGSGTGFTEYVLRVFGLASVVLFPAAVALGGVFPFLMRAMEARSDLGAGRAVGDIVALNTLGAIAGALSAGFLLLEFVGLWASIRMTAVLYLLVALLLKSSPRTSIGWRSIPVAGILLLVTLLDTSRLPVVRIDPLKKQETLLEVWEGSGGTVAVVRKANSLKIKVNNHYTLGDTASKVFEERQTDLPLTLHPDAKSVFYLGMGTGITAGAALRYPVERVVTCELVGDVITAAQKYFKPYVHGLFEDPRSEVLVEDGRHFLAAGVESFDLIVADLFVPWKAGTGSLYTVEHYRRAREGLKPGGLYAQWLALYQLTMDEVGSIGKSMLEVFPLVTVWRGDFDGDRSIVCFLGHHEPGVIDRQYVMDTLNRVKDEERLEMHGAFHDPASRMEDIAPFLMYYCGNLTLGRALVEPFSLNTDDRPFIEYGSPISNRRQKTRDKEWLVGLSLIDFLTELLTLAPPQKDPFLADASAREQRHVLAGLTLHLANACQSSGDSAGFKKARERLRELTSTP